MKIIENHTVNSGSELIDIQGDGFETILFIKKKPITLNWSDCEGSIGQYLLWAGVTNLEKKLTSLRQIFKGNLNTKTELWQQLYPLMELLSAGNYRIEYHSSLEETSLEPLSAKWTPSRDLVHMYPTGHPIVFTQTEDSLQKDRVIHYKREIGLGERPIALTLSHNKSYFDYILDGHHKLTAYSQLNIDPAIIRLIKENPKPIQKADFLAGMPESQRGADNYSALKDKYGR